MTTDLLRRAWNEAAIGYAHYFVPRFRPWLDTLLRVAEDDLSVVGAGPIVVGCCGPGVEVEHLARAAPERRVVAIDLSEKMIELTRERCRALSNVEAHVADATRLDAVGEPVALVVSAFGLQQMPDPPEVVALWTRALTAGGRGRVLFWPSDTEREGPFALAREIAMRTLGLTTPIWGQELEAAITGAGGRMLDDERIAHTMRHESAEVMWTEMSSSGPWRTLRMRFGEAKADEMRRQFLSRAPTGPFEHRPSARMIGFARSAP